MKLCRQRRSISGAFRDPSHDDNIIVSHNRQAQKKIIKSLQKKASDLISIFFCNAKQRRILYTTSSYLALCLTAENTQFFENCPTKHSSTGPQKSKTQKIFREKNRILFYNAEKKHIYANRTAPIDTNGLSSKYSRSWR